MTEKEFWKEFSAGKVAVHCPSCDMAKRFLTECERQGYRWSAGGIKPSEFTVWGVYTVNTSYKALGNILYVSFKEKYRREGCQVIEYM